MEQRDFLVTTFPNFKLRFLVVPLAPLHVHLLFIYLIRSSSSFETGNGKLIAKPSNQQAIRPIAQPDNVVLSLKRMRRLPVFFIFDLLIYLAWIS